MYPFDENLQIWTPELGRKLGRIKPINWTYTAISGKELVIISVDGGVDPFGVELNELFEVDEAVSVGINLGDHVVELLVGGRLPQAAHDGSELGR
ncbi:hypothetical protein ACFX1T_038106 [Malus domestica]